MRLVGLAVLLASCGFHPVDSGASGDDNLPNDAAGDATGSIDAMRDATIPPCPDDDHDGICNADDTWPCGLEPAAPPTTVDLTANGTETNFVLSTIDVDSGMGQLVVAAPGSTMRLKLHYAITDTACSDCIDQIEIGWAPGNRAGCVFDMDVPSTTGRTGNVDNSTMTMPATAGSYDLRANIGQNYSCTYNGATMWWGGAPAANRTIAKVCVH